MSKKAQSAMEFIMTYSWALLVVLIAIGALAFFGVLSPSKFIPETCNLGVGFACEDFSVVEDFGGNGDIFINVRNSLGKHLDFFTIHIEKDPPVGGDQMCGGFIGYIAISRLPPPVAGNPPPGETFRDGEMRPLKHFRPSVDDGINCEPASAPIGISSPACCSGVNNLYYATWIGSPFEPFVNTEICDSSTECGNSPVIGPLGSKFSENLIITYQVVGSAIAHKRTGKLSTTIE